MAEPAIRATRASIAPDVAFGDGVVIEADDLEIGPGARIGISESDGFRTPAGVQIRVRSLRVGAGAEIGPAVRIDGGAIVLGNAVRILPHSTLRVLDALEIGHGGTVNERCEISGRDVRIGQELWMLPGAKIGGGSAFEHASRLDAGHYLHLGVDTFINTARPVTIGHEVGLGTRTSIYTHGAYPSRLQGFPVAFDGVEIGDFSWLPGAIVNPGVRIGRNCVIGVNSLVTSSIPDGSLAAGSPARVIRENAYPRPMSREEALAFYEAFLASYASVLGVDPVPGRDGERVVLRTPDATYVAGAPIRGDVEGDGRMLVVGPGLSPDLGPATTALDTESRRIAGAADRVSDRLTNELRRYGIRFYSRPAGDRYVDWSVTPPSFGEPAGS
jgi:acetyltransferase-like isoleucine patch superfamily enzyme